VEFSVVIPVYNREREIRRGLESCLAQDHGSFEVVAVDDGSTDRSADVVGACSDPRVRLVRLGMNRGQGAARNAGIRAAAGDWIISFDSDDELLPGALSRIHEKIQHAGGEVERVAFQFRRDDGRISPLPATLEDEVMDYAAYTRWLEGRRLYDFLPCTRRCTFEAVRWPESRWSDHCLYNLDFAKQYRTLFCAETLALVHTDAGNRLSFGRRRSQNALDAAAELGAEMDVVLSRHGEGLREHAPATHAMYQRMRAAHHFLAGERGAGFRQILRCLRATPGQADAWLILALGLTNRSVFAAVRARRAPAT
jgi:glycosyltransferase involved in cell wall biosynthesis